MLLIILFSSFVCPFISPVFPCLWVESQRHKRHSLSLCTCLQRSLFRVCNKVFQTKFHASSFLVPPCNIRDTITPPALIASSGPDVAVAASSSASPEPAKKNDTIGGPNPGDGGERGCKRARSNRKGGETMAGNGEGKRRKTRARGQTGTRSQRHRRKKALRSI